MTISTMAVEVKPVEDLFKAGNLLILKASNNNQVQRYIVMVAQGKSGATSECFTGIVLHTAGEKVVKIGEVDDFFIRNRFEQFHGDLTLKV